MDRRSFLKILGYSSVALALPVSIKYLVDHVVANNYDRDLLKELFGDILNKITPEEMDWLQSLNETYYIFKIDGNVTVTKTPKAKYFISKLQKSNEWDMLEKTSNIFEASIKERQYSIQLHGDSHASNGQPYFWSRVRSRRAVIDRPNNTKWQNARGQQHEVNSYKVAVYKGRRVGNARWGNSELIERMYMGTYSSSADAARATNMTAAAVSGVLLGKIRFSKEYFFEKVAS